MTEKYSGVSQEKRILNHPPSMTLLKRAKGRKNESEGGFKPPRNVVKETFA